MRNRLPDDAQPPRRVVPRSPLGKHRAHTTALASATNTVIAMPTRRHERTYFMSLILQFAGHRMSRLDWRGRIVSESHRESHDEADKRDPQQRPARRLGVAVGFVECAVTLWCPQLGRAPPGADTVPAEVRSPKRGAKHAWGPRQHRG
jgi:hypothetical protein